MSVDLVMEFVFVLFVLEAFEANWQKGDNFGQLIFNMQPVYQKNILTFILMHPTFYFVIFIILKSGNYGFLLISILLMKTIDISLKISILDKLTKGKSLGGYEMLIKDDVKVKPLMKYLGVYLYPFMVYVVFMGERI